MTVAELIAKLQELPQDMEARVFNDEWCSLVAIEGIGVVEYKGKDVVWMGDITQEYVDQWFGT